MRNKNLLFLSIILSLNFCFSQKMDNDALEKIFTKVTDSVNGFSGYWEIIHRNRQLVCLSDEKHNRMRIITPIVQTNSLNKELLIDALTANFHSALDVKYANSEGVLWSVFTHPLKELSENEVISALEQVVNASVNFGTSFSSTEMILKNKNFSDNDLQEKNKQSAPVKGL